MNKFNSILRVANISNKVYLGDIQKTANYIIKVILSAHDNPTQDNPDFIVFPEFCLTGVNCGRILYNKDILSQCNTSVSTIAKATSNINAYIVIGSITYKNGIPVSSLFILKNGEIIDTVIDDDVFIISYNDASILISTLNNDFTFARFNTLASYNADVLVLPSNFNANAGSTKKLHSTLSFYATELACGISCVNGGVGDTSFPYINKGFCINVNPYQTLSFTSSLNQSITSTADFDIDIIRASRISKKLNIFTPDFADNYPDLPLKQTLTHAICKDPYLHGKDSDKYLDDLFLLAANSLYRRLSNISLNKMIIGISGGLDSTLALLICVRCCDLLGVPYSNIIACTMPGFGTSAGTKSNAHILMEKLGCTRMTIPVTHAVSGHFEDINHDFNNKDVTFENAQARERTQILLSLANKHGGIVVGTGDLSEEALGFCTFGGDHLSQYNVNVCITKTMLRQLLSMLIDTVFIDCSDVLLDILNTPISPELLPPDESGAISQKTEQILGPYELHDFFLYYLVKYNLTPNKILSYAVLAFAGDFDTEFIKEKLSLFLRRFYQNQYKRSCSPDSAVITDVSLCNSSYYIPSDYNPSNLITFD